MVDVRPPSDFVGSEWTSDAVKWKEFSFLSCGAHLIIRVQVLRSLAGPLFPTT